MMSLFRKMQLAADFTIVTIVTIVTILDRLISDSRTCTSLYLLFKVRTSPHSTTKQQREHATSQGDT